MFVLGGQIGAGDSEASRGTALVGSPVAGCGRDHPADALDCLATGRLGGGGHVKAVMSSLVAVVELELGLGNYQAALACAFVVCEADRGDFGTRTLPDLIEAAVRCGWREIAVSALERLSGTVARKVSDIDLGLLARSRALIASDEDTEPLYRAALVHLEHGAPVAAARTYLLYGEWLRRQRRRSDAREQLRTARDMFLTLGSTNFAARAHTELAATGEHARRRTANADSDLTPQEAKISQLVAQGLPNRVIASHLFISPATVDYHLRKVFRKLAVTSRTQLALKLSALSPPELSVAAIHGPSGGTCQRAV